tara:strand:- start:284 stop:655 length:372 start_codon:yes stop_codon:yes gene_type:complete
MSAMFGMPIAGPEEELLRKVEREIDSFTFPKGKPLAYLGIKVEDNGNAFLYQRNLIPPTIATRMPIEKSLLAKQPFANKLTQLLEGEVLDNNPIDLIIEFSNQPLYHHLIRRSSSYDFEFIEL